MQDYKFNKSHFLILHHRRSNYETYDTVMHVSNFLSQFSGNWYYIAMLY